MQNKEEVIKPLKEKWRKWKSHFLSEAKEVNTRKCPIHHFNWSFCNCKLAPGAEHDSGRDHEEGNEIVSNLEQEDIDDNAAILNDPTGSDSISGNGPAQLANRFESAANKDIIPSDEYRSLMRGLNTKQKEIVMYHRKWCKETTIALKYAERVQPYQVFVSGPGGVGKSHNIRLIQSDTI